jgi:uncharacterized radical SAM superfamily Fe-S cluster-containing enzyme
MMNILRSEKPVPAPAVQFSGGEPTMRDDLVEIIKKAKEVGFPQVQIATNGIKLAKDKSSSVSSQRRRLSRYTSFEGLQKIQTAAHIHKNVIANCRKRGPRGTCSTIIKGSNTRSGKSSVSRKISSSSGV